MKRILMLFCCCSSLLYPLSLAAEYTGSIYSGIWEDQFGNYYSIHANAERLVLIDLDYTIRRASCLNLWEENTSESISCTQDVAHSVKDKVYFGSAPTPMPGGVFMGIDKEAGWSQFKTTRSFEKKESSNIYYNFDLNIYFTSYASGVFWLCPLQLDCSSLGFHIQKIF